MTFGQQLADSLKKFADQLKRVDSIDELPYRRTVIKRTRRITKPGAAVTVYEIETTDRWKEAISRRLRGEC